MGIVDEFKSFISRGNVLDMSIGVIVGGAFGKIATSLTDDIIMPPIGMLLGHVNFKDLHFPLISDVSKMADPAEFAGKTWNLMHLPLEKVRSMGIPTIAYGNFINQVINFLIIAFCIFIVVKIVNNLAKKPEEVVEVTTKVCPECLSDIPLHAKRCKFCTAVQPEEKEEDAKK